MPTSTQAETHPSESVKTLVSFALFVHLFCVVVVLTSSFASSPLQQRLVSLFSFYTRTFHLDPNYLSPPQRLPAISPSTFHLTTGEGDTRLHQWLLTTADGATVHRFPHKHWRAGFPRRRLDMLARVGAFHAGLDMDEVPAEIARSLARNIYSQLEPDLANEPIYVRCVEHVGESDPSTFDPSDPDAEVNILYEADVWFDASESGPPTISVLKRSPTSQSAPPVDVSDLP